MLAAIGAALAVSAQAEPLPRSEVPAPLAAWVDWVLRDVPDAACPFAHGNAEHRQCSWPSRLSLDLQDGGGSFEQDWLIDREIWVSLPGSEELWPEDVRSGAHPLAVVARDGVPSVRLSPGSHRLSGNLRWPALPEFLQIPRETGLVSLRLHGSNVAFPERDLEGRIWLQREAATGAQEDRLELRVHRRVIDDVPLRLDTDLELRVSGSNREIELGPVFPAGFIPMSISSPLPARLEPDGRLRIQARPGNVRILLAARHLGGPVGEVSLGEALASSGGGEEVWVFDARPDLRLVEVEGAASVDPQQTSLPEEWRALPAYLMTPGSTLRLVEQRRGDQDPAPDRLELARNWWLDFEGGGYTVRDEITGSLRRSWRLEGVAPLRLGRVAIDGRDQFISRLDGEDRLGVEVRQGQARIDADGRIEQVGGGMPAVGWAHDFEQVSGRLHLPPGWRLLHASGVDDVVETWITRWTLLDLFLVLVTSAVVMQLFGSALALLTLLTLALIYHEPGAPSWSWLLVLATYALLRVIPQGRLRRVTQAASLLAIVALLLIAIPFAVRQARVALHPALELPGVAVQEGRGSAEELPAKQGVRYDVSIEQSEIAEGALRSLPAAAPPAPIEYAPDPAALVSTGPGLPRWGWQTVRLGWRGPVRSDQQLRFWLLPPWANAALGWLRVALVLALVVALLDRDGRMLRWIRGGSTGAAQFALIGALAGAALPSTGRAELPSPELLAELRKRLVEAPDCFPLCAASPRMDVVASPDELRLRFAVDVAAHSAVPLPGGLPDWTPERVSLGGLAASGLARSPDGRLWLPLPPGRHEIELWGALPERESVQILLPMRPQRVSLELDGWTADGVRADGNVGDSLGLARLPGSTDGVAVEPVELPPFAALTRALRLDLSWQIENTVERATPPGQALFLEIPLLPGESVASEGVIAADGVVRVELGPQESARSWTSLLQGAPALVLEAGDDPRWSERWRLDAGPIWHVEASGIPVVHDATQPAFRVREWRPWPGERVELEVTRPSGAEGRTLTIDRALLTVRPGLHASDTTLGLWIRASRGLRHELSLPAQAELQSVTIDGALQPVRSIDGRVSLPVHPGTQAAELVWRTPEPIRWLYRTPAIDPGAPSVNAEIVLQVPGDRWVLSVGGPRLGPAVLFWSTLVVALLVAFVLGLSRLTPLGWGSWFLLFVGLTQVPIYLAAVVVGWLLALAWRERRGTALGDLGFDLVQLTLAIWTALALVALLWAVQRGLLGLPEMQIAGNGSSSQELRWYADRSEAALASAWMLSVPLLVYRIAMLAWALWLARALLRWLRFAWTCFATGGLWRPLRLRRRAPA